MKTENWKLKREGEGREEGEDGEGNLFPSFPENRKLGNPPKVFDFITDLFTFLQVLAPSKIFEIQTATLPSGGPGGSVREPL